MTPEEFSLFQNAVSLITELANNSLKMSEQVLELTERVTALESKLDILYTIKVVKTPKPSTIETVPMPKTGKGKGTGIL